VDPISPELALVDPELARASIREALARPPVGRPREPAEPVAADPVQMPVRDAVAPAGELAPNAAAAEESEGLSPPGLDTLSGVAREDERLSSSSPSRRRMIDALLTLSLVLNAILIAIVVDYNRNGRPAANISLPRRTATIPPDTVSHDSNRRSSVGVTRPQSKPTSAAQSKEPIPERATPRATRSTPVRRPRTGTTRVRPSVSRESAALERKLLAAVVRSPSEHLPSALIDKATGLAKNLQAVCQPSASQSFSCVIRPAHHKPAEGLHVRYSRGRGGRWIAKWYGYRRG
jgi:hypothetical protein